MSTIHPIILAGGSGTRLWPLSRKYYPKQFIQLREFDHVSLFQKTLQRSVAIGKLEDILVVTNADYKFHCLSQADEIGLVLREDQILIEPAAKNTLAAIAFAVKHIANDDDVAFITPSDNIIDDVRLLAGTIESALVRAGESLVTFGVTPTCPHTGYGYVSADRTSSAPFRVLEFKEKPDTQRAEEYIRNGYFWNSGSFLFSKKVFQSELRKWNPSFFETFESSDDIAKVFETIPDLSIDYGLLEYSDNIYLSPLTCYWDDLGSFDALGEYLENTGGKNIDIIGVESQNNLVLSETDGKKIALIGIENLLIIDTKDALLISKKGESQKIKDIVGVLKKADSPLADYGTTVYRPWGSYTIIDEGVGFKSKRLTVLPGKKLSLQMHYHRSEHWVVVSGTATVTIGDQEIILRK